MDIWKGMFQPVTKHRLGTGNIRNHIEVKNVRLEDASDIAITCYVTFGFIGDGENGSYKFDFIYPKGSVPNEKEIMDRCIAELN